MRGRRECECLHACQVETDSSVVRVCTSSQNVRTKREQQPLVEEKLSSKKDVWLEKGKRGKENITNEDGCDLTHHQ